MITWDMIHYNSRYLPRNTFNSWIRQVPLSLQCQECKYHMMLYLSYHPPELLSPFIWTWQFHNHVNQRLSKSGLCYTCASFRYMMI